MESWQGLQTWLGLSGQESLMFSLQCGAIVKACSWSYMWRAQRKYIPRVSKFSKLVVWSALGNIFMHHIFCLDLKNFWSNSTIVLGSSEWYWVSDTGLVRCFPGFIGFSSFLIFSIFRQVEAPQLLISHDFYATVMKILLLLPCLQFCSVRLNIAQQVVVEHGLSALQCPCLAGL